MTYMQAALTVLAHAGRPLSVPEITAVAVAQGLVRPRGKTPDRTMASVLYRRMAADPDAPVVSRGGRLWLRGRPLPAEETGYLTRPARRARATGGHQERERGKGNSGARRVTVLPPPPLAVPLDALSTPAGMDDAAGGVVYAPVRRERAVARAGERGTRVLAKLARRRDEPGAWDAARTAARVVTPLLAHLGYRAGRDADGPEHAGRGRSGYTLRAGGAVVMTLDVWRLGRDLGDDEAWQALARAQAAGALYGALCNGEHLRVYATASAEAQDSAAAALVLTLDLRPAGGDATAEQAALLWLLARQNVAAGALDAYTTDRAVGAALLSALDRPDSPLARALVGAAREQLGVALPATLVLRHARLAVRGKRGSEGEPLPADIATVAAVRGPRLAPSQPEEDATHPDGEPLFATAG